MSKEAGEPLRKWASRLNVYEGNGSKVLQLRSAPIATAVDTYLRAQSNGAPQKEIQEHAARIKELSETLPISLDEIEKTLGFTLDI